MRLPGRERALRGKYSARLPVARKEAFIDWASPEALVEAWGPDLAEQELSPALLERRDLRGSLVQLKLRR